ncbi:MAG: DUF2779 domain-containing protein [Lentisphaerae bacterium]|nr:DUF2779 domain-containing protein [Lentisphaerota bacterium]
MPVPAISKSKYLSGLQCPKLLWVYYRAKDWIPPVDAATQAVFDQGHVVGELAKQLYPGGIEVPWDTDLPTTVRKTKALLKQRVPLFEASLLGGGVYARADILEPVGRGQWDLIEVKSTGKVKDIHIPDLAAQRYCYEAAGLYIRRCHLMHIDTQYLLRGNPDPNRFFQCEDVTDQVDAMLPEVPRRVREMRKTIGQEACPEVEIGPHCSDPYDCPLTGRCWKAVNSRPHSIFTLYRLGAKKTWALYAQGVLDNAQIDEGTRLSGNQQIQIEAERTGQLQINKPAVRSFLERLYYPLQFLDFESFQTAIPLVQLTRPYQQIPFQFSLHQLVSSTARPRHFGWIWDGSGSPFDAMLEQLRACLTDQGAVVAYNASFEIARLREAAAACPTHRKWVEAVIDRTVDLLEPFRSFDVYHPAQHGSASMKSVLPALTGQDYAGMAISDGGMASQAYLTTFYGNAPQAAKEQTIKDLEAYCGQDTLGMWDIVKALGKLVRKP